MSSQAMPQPEDSISSSPFGSAFAVRLAIIVILSIIIELFRAAQYPGFARAESCFAEGAREMFALKEYIAPLFYGVPYFDKPPLYYWLIISIYKVFGVSLLAARASSVLASALSISISALFIKRLGGEKLAIATALILSTTLGFFEFSSIAMPDMLLCLFENIAIYATFIVCFCQSKDRQQWLAIMTIAFALGWMTKGPIALIVPAVSIFITSALFKQCCRFTLFELLGCALAFVAVLAPWHWLVYTHYGMPAFNWLYVQGNFGRFLGQHNAYNFGHNPTYMLTNLLGTFLPWTIFLVPAFFQTIISNFSSKTFSPINKLIILMTVWAILNTLIFSFSSSNWGYYSLPIFPALALITAHFLISLENKISARKIQIISLTIAIGFAFSLSVYSLVFLPKKAKKDTYLGFARHIKPLPTSIPFFFHYDLVEQCQLTDYIMFETGRPVAYTDQEKLKQMIYSQSSFIVLIPKHRFEVLQAIAKTKLQIIDNQPFKYLNFPGCQLTQEAPPGTPISIILALYKNSP